MENSEITFEDLMFQLFYRDLLTNDIIQRVNIETSNISKKFYLVGIIRGLMSDGKWEVLAESNRLKSKQNECKINRSREASSGSSSSSSSGGRSIVNQFLSGAGATAQEASKEILKEVALKAIQNVLGV